MRNISSEFREQLDGDVHDIWKTPDQGCASLLVAAFDPSLSGASHTHGLLAHVLTLNRTGQHLCDGLPTEAAIGSCG